MSFKNLGNKQTIVLHNCEIDNKKKTILSSHLTHKLLDTLEQNDKQ